jgi:ketosteroid isomerase-like protein
MESTSLDENVKVVRRAYEHLNRGDVEGVVELCDDHFLLDMSERVFNPDTYRGHDGIRRFHKGVEDAWESYRWDVEETRIAGDSVVALLHCQGQSREGGPEVDWRVAWLWRFRGGRPVSLRFYRDRAQALQAAGLSE